MVSHFSTQICAQGQHSGVSSRSEGAIVGVVRGKEQSSGCTSLASSVSRCCGARMASCSWSLLASSVTTSMPVSHAQSHRPPPPPSNTDEARRGAEHQRTSTAVYQHVALHTHTDKHKPVEFSSRPWEHQHRVTNRESTTRGLWRRGSSCDLTCVTSRCGGATWHFVHVHTSLVYMRTYSLASIVTSQTVPLRHITPSNENWR